jgi:predicted nucleic acid-binding protein
VLAVDTNVLIYAADADSQFHAPCRDRLERQGCDPMPGTPLGV